MKAHGVTTEYSTSLFQKAVILLASIGEYDDESLYTTDYELGKDTVQMGYRVFWTSKFAPLSGLDIVNQLQFC